MNRHFQNLYSHLTESVKIEEQDFERIYNKFQLVTLKKKEILLFKGEVSHHMRFISQGCLKSYYLDNDAQEHILQFGIENWWINDLYSYITQTPARQFVQAIEPSFILQVHRDALEKLFLEVPPIERFFRLKIQKAYVALQERTMFNLSQSAELRYLDFRNKYREIEQRVPQYMIASYLGITPEFLSTIRKNLIGA
ncbi:Crp/Fnr family transcriptional regulator [soil metagenome]